jgi:hypothetical protein
MRAAGAHRPAGRPGTAAGTLRCESISRIARLTRDGAARHRRPRLTAHPAPPLRPLQNKKNTPERLELKKYNKHLRRVTLPREIK